ncbi:MAG: SGNH/GDSL hydrolase family protein [Nitrososphaerota archaeon]
MPPIFAALSPAPSSSDRRTQALRTHGRRVLLAILVLIALLLALAFVPEHAHATGSFVGPKTRYLALGDSLAFGFQPDLDWSHSYTKQWYNELKNHGTSAFTDYGCNGETSATFINGGCPYAYALHNYYLGSQLNAAVFYLNYYKGKVSPVSLDIGANDLLPDIDKSTCAVSSSWESDLAALDSRLTGTILPQLVAALTNSSGARTGDLVMMNYYDPYQNTCPNSLAYVQELNSHLAADAAQFNVPIADVLTAFGGTATPNPNICPYTWMCSVFHDIHATDTGNGVIAGAFESRTGY